MIELQKFCLLFVLVCSGRQVETVSLDDLPQGSSQLFDCKASNIHYLFRAESKWGKKMSGASLNKYYTALEMHI